MKGMRLNSPSGLRRRLGAAAGLPEPGLATVAGPAGRGRFSRMGRNDSPTPVAVAVVVGLMASGAGVGILPGRVATRIKAQKLEPLGHGSPSFQDKISLVFRADVQKSKASRQLAREWGPVCIGFAIQKLGGVLFSLFKELGGKVEGFHAFFTEQLIELEMRCIQSR